MTKPFLTRFLTILTAATILWLILIELAKAQTTACVAVRGSESDWHYRTRIDDKGERCYYQGKAMKPRAQLYWPPPPMETKWNLDGRFTGAKEGWEHKE